MATANSPLEDALRDWTKVLGCEFVNTQRKDLVAVERATFESQHQIAAVLRPHDREDISECLKVAHQYRVPVYPISGGKNYGYGSKVPASGNNVVLDLGRLNRITDYNEELGYVALEPGVTFQQIADYLQNRNSPLMFSVTGGPPDGSPVGNTLDRGFGVGPHGERSANIAAVEAILADGSTLISGYGKYTNARAKHVDRFGVGPSLDAIFMQSNFAVVTRMTFWLLPKPVDLRLMTVSVSDQQLAGWLKVVRGLLLSGAVRPYCVGMLNEFRRAQMVNSVPATSSGHDNGGPWHVSLGLYSASPTIGSAHAEHIDSQVRSIGLQPNWHTQGDSAFVGTPSWQGIDTWYSQTGVGERPNPQPETDGCGLLWLGSVFPLQAEIVLRGLRVMHSTVSGFGFEPHVSVIFHTARSVILNLGIGYNRRESGSDKLANDCYDAVLSKLVAMGCYPYRLPVNKMNSLPPSDDAHDSVAQRIKDCLDPHGVIAPGRYDFSVRDGEPEV